MSHTKALCVALSQGHKLRLLYIDRMQDPCIDYQPAKSLHMTALACCTVASVLDQTELVLMGLLWLLLALKDTDDDAVQW